MKTRFIFQALALSLFGFSACSDDAPNPSNEGESVYLIQTMSEVTQLKPGFMSSYFDFPSGTIVNSTQPTARQGQANEGWRTYNGQVYKMFNASFERGIHKLNITSQGVISYGASILTGNTINGSGNFVIENDNKGYYWDGNEPWAIQTFNPASVQRTGKIEEDFEARLRREDSRITFQGIGQHFLAIKGGKLYADVVYSSGAGMARGMFNDVFNDISIAVIDLATQKYEKTITIPNTQSIAFINDNEMYSFDTNGDLYILCQGGPGALGGRSKIARIKAAESVIDSNWELKYADLYPADQGKFTSLLAKNGKLIVFANSVPLSLTPNNINTGEIWKYHVVDINSKAITAVEGTELSTNSGGAYAAFELDGKVILRVNAPSKTGVTGYYELNGTQATQIIHVSDGHVAGFTKASVQ
ncbi:hypothetical protein M8998_09675 [Sphingobacterium sp. lm-10]|uniref:hypothetical protein n=1 Tax=Sphingobacterium sp. lm-10 TaxID=2944904 RepID=UPI002021EF9F|nr:hypothetical protein [Sphingobacterium sp. lm-10]MCL7988205.1 hypothetical protein [Sphingobacterium sp. lm-10]